MEELDTLLLETEERMEKSTAVLKDELSGLRTGKASPSLVDGVSVEYYGSTTRLREIAGITTPESRLIVINPYDPSALPAIEKAILGANIGVTPLNDGRIIRIPIPELTEERRKELSKVASRQGEEARVAVRNVRRDANETIKSLLKNGDITEDDRTGGLDEVQKLTDTYIGKIDSMVKQKEEEILSV